jgi:hypothetical protein
VKHRKRTKTRLDWTLRLGVLVAMLLLFLGSQIPASAQLEAFELLGHEPLGGRGMNSALAVHRGFVYVGSRIDGSGEREASVLVVDSTNPSQPRVVSKIGQPDVGNPGESSRELRVWPSAELLIVLSIPCEAGLHRCEELNPPPRISFFDLTEPSTPRILSTYEPEVVPHEMFLWLDPNDSARALLFLSTWLLRGPDLKVVDISRAREGRVEEIATFDASADFSINRRVRENIRLHSISVSDDGKGAWAAWWGGGVSALDISGVTEGTSSTIKLATQIEGHARWPAASAHSAVQVAGKPRVLVTDEVYAGCPGGWARLVDVANPSSLKVVDEFRTEGNQASFCRSIQARRSPTFSSHNPTVVGSLALISWHAAGLVALQVSDDELLEQGRFLPEPLSSVQIEDPFLGSRGTGVAMWSYPVVSDGLVYVIDVRNGLYILDYKGAGRDLLVGRAFAEGNSNISVNAVDEAKSRQPEDPPGTEEPNYPMSWLATGVLGLAVAMVGLVWIRSVWTKSQRQES